MSAREYTLTFTEQELLLVVTVFNKTVDGVPGLVKQMVEGNPRLSVLAKVLTKMDSAFAEAFPNGATSRATNDTKDHA